MKTLLLLFMLIFAVFGNLLRAQGETLYKNGRIVTTDGTAIPFQKANKTGELFHYKTLAGEGAISAENVAGLDLRTGTKAGKGALIFGITGTVFSVLLGLGTGNTTERIIIQAVIVGSAYAGLGGLLGFPEKTYKNVYANPLLYGAAYPPRQIDTTAGCRLPGLAFRVAF